MPTKKKRPKVNPISHFADRSKTPMPREQLADMPFVYDAATARIICPWPKGPLHFMDEARLLTVMALVDKLQPDGVVWIWPDPNRAPVGVQAPEPRSWLARWAEGRQSYVSGRRAA